MPDNVGDIESASPADNVESGDASVDVDAESASPSSAETALESDGGTPQDGAGPGPIPYERFSEVNRQAREYREKLEALEAQHNDFQEKVRNYFAQQQQHSRASQGADRAPDPVQQLSQRFEALEQQLQQERLASQATALKGEVGSVLTKHPELAPFENAIVAEKWYNPRAKIETIAQKYLDHINAIWDRRQQAYVEKKTATAEKSKGIVKGGGTPAPPSKSIDFRDTEAVERAVIESLRRSKKS